MRILLIAAAASIVTGAPALADAVHRTVLQELPFPAPDYHTVTVKTVIDQGGAVAAHTHPGAEMAFVEAGMAMLTVAGQPPRSLVAGDSFSIAQGTVHMLTNSGTGPLTVISTYVVAQGQPLATPAKP